MKTIIAGGRNFTDYKKLCEACDQLLQDQTNIEIVSGAYYRGADKLGEQYAIEKGFPVQKFPADWKRFGKSGGPKRNQQMAEYADALIAFWDGKSRGTQNMLYLAKAANLKIRVIKY